MIAAVTQSLGWFSAGFQGGVALYSSMRAIALREKTFIPPAALSAVLALSGLFETAAAQSPASPHPILVSTAPAILPIVLSSICFVFTWLFFFDGSGKNVWGYRAVLFAFSIITACFGSFSGSPAVARIGAFAPIPVIVGTGLIEVFGSPRRLSALQAPYLVALLMYSIYSAAAALTLSIPLPLMSALMAAAFCIAAEARAGAAKAASVPRRTASGSIAAARSGNVYRALFEKMIDGVVYVDREGRIIECNDAFARLAGFEKDALISTRYADIAGEDADGRGFSAPRQQEFRRPDGSAITVELRRYDGTGESGEPDGFCVIVRENSDTKRFEAMWKRYEAIVNTSLDFMVFIDGDYRCEAINDAFCISLNRKREDIIGRPVNEFMGDAFFLHDIKPFVDTCFTGYAIYHQGSFVAGKLGERFMDMGFYPYHAGDEITHAIMIAHDITELMRTEKQLQKSKADLEERVADRTRDLIEMNSILESEIMIREQAESELRKSEEKYRQLVETMTDGLFVLQKDATLAYVNSRMTVMLGYDPGEMIGRSVYDFLNKNNRAVMKEQLVKRSRGSTPPYEIEWVKKNGRKLQSFVSPQILYDEHGAVTGSFGVIKDMTSRKAEEAELKKAKELAERANMSKSEFLANISHEIRTPMNAILGFSELLESRISDEIQREYLAAITNSGRTLLGLINDILDLSKIEAGKFTFELSPLGIRGVIREMENIFSRNLKEKNLRFFTSIDSSVPESVNLDGIRIRQVLFNLIGNAVKFTAEGFIRVEASARPSVGVANAVDVGISVQDTGIGVPEDQREIIFEPFRQRDGQVHAHYGGSGLGLTITRRLVEAMGGGLSLVSEEGAGSTFIVSLKDIDVVTDEQSGEAGIGGEKGSYDLKNRTILVVDDVESNRLLFRVYLKSAGVTVLEAENGRDAIRMAEVHLPDLILMDIVMPGMSGDDVIRALREDPALCRIPVVVITASSLGEREDSAKGLCDGFLVKPVSRKELFGEMARILAVESGAVTGGEPAAAEASPASDGGCDLPPEAEFLLTGSYFTRWEQIRRRVVFDEIENFAEDVMALGKQYSIRPLVDWSEALLHAARSFNMDVLPEILEKYDGIIASGRPKKHPGSFHED